MQKTKNNPDCEFVRDHLFSYQEKKLLGEKNQKFEDHINTCIKCRELVHNFHSVSASIEAKRADEPNPFIQTRTIQKIESELERGNKPYFAFSKRIFQPFMLSTIILTAVFIGLVLGKQVDSEFSGNLSRQNDIQFMKSDLYITDFTVEDNVFFDNH
jgi:predicted anti-sigma-YlaC factor YlaD